MPGGKEEAGRDKPEDLPESVGEFPRTTGHLSGGKHGVKTEPFCLCFKDKRAFFCPVQLCPGIFRRNINGF